MATLEGICYRTVSRAPMRELHGCTVTAEGGVADDFRGAPGKRQVTVLSLESWRDACAAAGAELPWTTRRANLLVSGLRFEQSQVGRTLKIGDLELLITRETDPCRRMEESHPGLLAALQPEWRGGVCCRVVAGGQIAVGDVVAWMDP